MSAATNNLSYENTATPLYLRENEIGSMDDSKEIQKTITRITALGSRAGTVQNYNAQGDTILLPTPSDDP